MPKDKIEYVEVTVKVPKAIIDFYDGFMQFMGSKEDTGETYVKQACEDFLKDHTEQFIGETCDSMFWDGRQEVVRKYGLAQVINAKAL